MAIEEIINALYDIKYDVDNNSIEDLTLKENTCNNIVAYIDDILELFNEG